MIRAARQAVDLLLRAENTWRFEDPQHGLSDQEWMVLRFLARANSFSRSPSALAQFVGTTRSAVSQLLKGLEAKGYVERRPSVEDKRSVSLRVTPQGDKMLTRDPIGPLVNAISALELGANNFRDALRDVLGRLGTNQHRHHADNCGECIFLSSASDPAKGKAQMEFTCRFFRSGINSAEMDLLCFKFEQRRLDRAGG
ncbi:MarR family winged helix-turn-helix transcriptional regulator [Bradyrhizobium niftali]|uniref:MarR family winged helix-turn-helix transcriptional regulator n=1 Tax=Bradyrhizobium niftali TaxID=2560055 RepID=UPI0032220C54